MTKERKDVVPYETICNNHNQVIFMLKQFKKTGDIWYVDQSIKLVRHCKKQGQKLENRLKLYFDVFTTKLGFKRVYKKMPGKKLKSWQK